MTSSLLLTPTVRKFACVATVVAMLGLTGCGSVAPSHTATGAGTGAAIGAVGGAVVGANSGMGTLGGAAAGAGAGAIIGGIVGMVQDAKDRKEQDRLAQERAYQQELAKKRSEEAKRRAEIDEEMNIAQGFRISDLELNDAQKKLDVANDRLKKLRDERAAALAKKKALDDARDHTLQAEAEIARLEEEINRLKSDDPMGSGRTSAPATAAAQPASASTTSAAAKPGM